MRISMLTALVGLSLLTLRVDAATIQIVNADGAGEGFNDPTVVAPVGGNPGTTLGQQRLNVFQAAANQWGAVLTSPVTIRINARFDPQTCDANGAVLGSAGASNWARAFTNTPPAPYNETWFSIAEANALAGSDLDATGDDIGMTFNVSIDAGCLPGTTGWWYDTAGVLAVPADRIALMPVVFHEIAHGLGFQTLTNTANGQFAGTSGNPNTRRPDIWAHFLMDRNLGANGTTWIGMGDGQNGGPGNAERAASAIDDPNLVWSGANVTATASSYLDPNPAAIIHAPAGIAGSYDAQPASFGPLVALSGLRGFVAAATDGAGASPTDACEAITNGAAISGRIALVDRGNCNFTVKVANAQAVGAIAVLVANNVAAGLPGMGGADPTITIPSYGISQALGASIVANIAAPVDASLGYNFATLAGMNGGYLRMYAPNPLEPGSSVSHFSTAASPNLLMEPALNQELFNETDLTVPLFRDIFWPINDAAIANKAPTINAASEFVVTLNTASPLTEIVFGDVDSGTGAISLRFQPASGTITLLAAAGVTTAGSGTNDATITGTRSTLLGYVVGGNVRFTTALDDVSDVPLTLTVNDNGNTGTGGALTAVDNGTIVVNQAPVAVNDTGTVAEGATLTVPSLGVLSNDTDANLDPLTAVMDSTTTNGTLTLNSNGGYTYVHNGSESISDSFTYHANDGMANSNTATVSITVTPVNDNAPVAVADNGGTVAEGGTLNVTAPGVLGNDTDLDGSTLTAVLDATTTNGSLTLDPNGSFSYVHNGSETTSDSFTYHANDGVSNSNTVTVSITVTGANDAPTVATPIPDQSNPEGTLINLSVAGNFADVDVGQSLSFSTLSTLPPGLSFNANGSFSGTIDFTAAAGSPYSITVTADDSNGGTVSDTFVWSVTDVSLNQPPAFTNEPYSFDVVVNASASTAVGSVSASDANAGDVLTFAITGGNTGNAFAIDPNTGAITVATSAAVAPVNTVFTLSVSVSDGNGGNDTGTVSIRVISADGRIFADGFEN